MLRLIFLGTSAARPTIKRNASSIAVQREGELFLFDCGEGTQRQLMKYRVGFDISGIFVTHMHVDHYLGIAGLLRTMSLQGRVAPMFLFGPPGSADTLRTVRDLGGDHLSFRAQVRELVPGEEVEGNGFVIRTFKTRHAGATSMGFALVEEPRPGRFDIATARKLGIPEGPLYGQLQRGQAVELPNGSVVDPAEVVAPERPGRKVVYTGDTRPQAETVNVAKGADLLIHEGTFGDSKVRKARLTGHSTVREAASVARQAGVRRLILTHISAQYTARARTLEREAREEFAQAQIARDGLTIEIPFQD